MKVPNKVKILGIEYHVELQEVPMDSGQFVWGYTDYAQTKIVLCSTLSEEKRVQTLFHELVHVMLHEVGNDDQCNDESLVNPLGNVLYQVLKDNELA
ncbi:ImmA/IrrE family metallo-endopeptidase [Levilactobacillus brevis]|uniref:ImmA/IrrE family metallo-endopeptidase n=1 Tax=Levilactobacillus brevis TaxID=1580 RepID=UPI001BDDD96D|nr:ImmA/IrrE family metallo-endopeptidase [Levilactobacillus brevis]